MRRKPGDRAQGVLGRKGMEGLRWLEGLGVPVTRNQTVQSSCHWVVDYRGKLIIIIIKIIFIIIFY